MAHYIFVTGGVASSLGKGVCAASIAFLLKESGLRVNMLKIDPYLNISAGDLSPLQHGEVFITKDGKAVDLDIGYYERFLDQEMTRSNQITMGEIYQNLFTNMVNGRYSGETIQVIPHVTNEIIHAINLVGKNCDIVIVEIGGTIGDIESLPIIEALRQMHNKEKKITFIHLVWILYLQTSKEYKTKPAQHSVRSLQSLGIQANILLCRSEHAITQQEKEKIDLLCGVRHIINIPNQKSIYTIPETLYQNNILSILLPELEPCKPNVSFLYHTIQKKIRVGIIGKYTGSDSYKSLDEAFLHIRMCHGVEVEGVYIKSECVTEKDLRPLDGILVPGGFGVRGIESKIMAVYIGI